MIIQHSVLKNITPKTPKIATSKNINDFINKIITDAA